MPESSSDSVESADIAVLKKRENWFAIVHVKGPDRGNSADRSLWEDLFAPKGWGFANQTRDLIGHYVPHVEGLNFRWFYKWPW